jgi:hypothetical protein
LIVPAPGGTTVTGKKHDRTNRPPGGFAMNFVDFLSAAPEVLPGGGAQCKQRE